MDLPKNQVQIPNISVITRTDIGRRPRQEDRYFNQAPLVGNIFIYGLFDGHGTLGGDVADICVSSFPYWIRQKYAMNGGDLGATLPASFHSVDTTVRILCEDEKAIQLQTTGATALITVVTTDSIWIANAGDSLALVLLKNGECHMITPEHKVSAPHESQRIREEGGVVTYDVPGDPSTARIQGTLNVSRGIGDFFMKKHFIPNPDVRSISGQAFSQVRAIIMASDGLWDVMREKDVEEIVSIALYSADASDNTSADASSQDDKNKEKDIAELLVASALNRGSTDNITVTCIFL